MLMTVSKLREYVDTSLTDSVLGDRLRALETLIRSYTHNNFQIREIRSQSEIMDGFISNPPKHLKSGDTIQISESLLNNGLYTVTEISENGAASDAELIDCTKNLITKVSYPPDVIMGAVNMIKWDLNYRDKTGIQSETISRHSVTYFNMDGNNSVSGYPKSLLGFLTPYKKARF